MNLQFKHLKVIYTLRLCFTLSHKHYYIHSGDYCSAMEDDHFGQIKLIFPNICKLLRTIATPPITPGVECPLVSNVH